MTTRASVSKPRFFALLPVRDEADIISQCLNGLLLWADRVYVFDTGSVDETWDIVQEHARRDKRLVPVRREPVYYSEMKLRGYLFDLARAEMQDGDWFLRVDADEFHHILPPKFVKDYMRPHETVAYHQYYDFHLTQSEVDAWERGDETVADRQRPIEMRRRVFTPSVYSEPRMCRYRASMQWPKTVSFPFNAGFIARERLPIRHYPHRDPEQLRRRAALRAVMMRHVATTAERESFSHWKVTDIEEFVVADDALGLRRWPFGAPLPEVRQLNHLAPSGVRLAQRAVHAALLPLLDRRRPRFHGRPDPLPCDVQKELEQALSNL